MGLSAGSSRPARTRRSPTAPPPVATPLREAAVDLIDDRACLLGIGKKKKKTPAASIVCSITKSSDNGWASALVAQGSPPR